MTPDDTIVTCTCGTPHRYDTDPHEWKPPMTADDAALYAERDDALLRAERAEQREAELEAENAELRAALRGDLGIFQPQSSEPDPPMDVWTAQKRRTEQDKR